MKKASILVILFLSLSISAQEIVIDPLYRIQVLIQMEKYDHAIQYTEKLNDSLKCTKAELLGFSYGKLGKYKTAAKHYASYVKECDPSSIQRINLGDNYFKSDQFEKAKEQFLKVPPQDANYSLAQYNAGMIEYQIGNKEKAVEYFTTAINKTSNGILDFDYVEMQIRTLNELEDYDTAFQNIETILNLFDKNSLEYKNALVIKASVFAAQGAYKKAIQILDILIASSGDQKIVLIECYALQLNYYSKMNQKEKACEAYRQVEKLNPDADILKEYNCD